MRALRPFPFCVVALLCASCAAPLPRPPAAELEQRWQAHAAQLAPLIRWELRGRLAVRVDERGGQATLNWVRDVARQTIRLNGPFGSGAVRIVEDDSGARLQDAGNREQVAGSAEELLFVYTGWQLPVAYLDWWLRGLPVPGVSATRELDDTGRLRILRQQGWEVRYENYARFDQYDLPQRLSLTRQPDATTPALEARFVIDRWQQVR